jgi:hypothetical protein
LQGAGLAAPGEPSGTHEPGYRGYYQRIVRRAYHFLDLGYQVI